MPRLTEFYLATRQRSQNRITLSNASAQPDTSASSIGWAQFSLTERGARIDRVPARMSYREPGPLDVVSIGWARVVSLSTPMVALRLRGNGPNVPLPLPPTLALRVRERPNMPL
jgi:hypothetical protein